MLKIKKRHDEELNRMYDKLKTLEPGTEEYDNVVSVIVKAQTGDTEKKELDLKLIMFGAGLVITPVIDLLCKRSLTKYIGTIEQMETFTSSAGRSIGSWFRWK